MPQWLQFLASASLILAAACAAAVIIDLLAGNRQKMWIMNLVWPLTVLWAGPLGLWVYFRVGRPSSKKAVENAKSSGRLPPGRRRPFWQSVGIGALHCGSGCTLGDLLAEGFTGSVSLTLFGSGVFGAWALDYLLAFLLGIAFQYFTIQPLRRLSPREGLVAALKADALSLTSWQVGMYGWMAIALFLLYGPVALPKDGPVFWFMMQIGMLAGLLTSYPVNWFLLRKGIKEVM